MTGQRRSVVRLAALLVACALVMGLYATGTASAQTYPSVPTLTVDQPIVDPCTTVILTGTGYLPNAPVTITVNGQVVGTVTTDGSGNFTFPYPVPCSAAAGQLQFTAADRINSLNTTVTVRARSISSVSNGANSATQSASAASTGSGSGSLPVSGSNTDNFVRIAVLLIALGGILLLALRRRDRSTA